jgi:isoleucyl-tRNA synthetase
MACEYTDRIEIGLLTDSAEMVAAIEQFRGYIGQETLANKIVSQPVAGVEPFTAKVLGHDLALYVRVVQ